MSSLSSSGSMRQVDVFAASINEQKNTKSQTSSHYTTCPFLVFLVIWNFPYLVIPLSLLAEKHIPSISFDFEVSRGRTRFPSCL